MGEFAYYHGKRIKIGTCEELFDLRADQYHLVTVDLDAAGTARGPLDPEGYRFRFPFPDEDGKAPGEFTDYDRGLSVPGVDLSDNDHSIVQFVASGPGYNLCVPCPESAKGKEWAKTTGTRIHRNGFNGHVKIQSQRPKDGKLMLCITCGACSSTWRLETLEDAAIILDPLEAMAVEQENPHNRYGSATRAAYYRQVADRIRAGYTSPPSWVTRRTQAPASA